MTEKSESIELNLDQDDNTDLNLIINTEEELILNLNQNESINLIKNLKKGPNEKAKEFLKNAIKFYEEMKKKEEIYNF
jgi:hypothetical protein